MSEQSNFFSNFCMIKN